MEIFAIIALIRELGSDDLGAVRLAEIVTELTREVIPLIEAAANRDLVNDADAVRAVREVLEALQAVAAVIRTLPERSVEERQA